MPSKRKIHSRLNLSAGNIEVSSWPDTEGDELNIDLLAYVPGRDGEDWAQSHVTLSGTPAEVQSFMRAMNAAAGQEIANALVPLDGAAFHPEVVAAAESLTDEVPTWECRSCGRRAEAVGVFAAGPPDWCDTCSVGHDRPQAGDWRELHFEIEDDPALPPDPRPLVLSCARCGGVILPDWDGYEGDRDDGPICEACLPDAIEVETCIRAGLCRRHGVAMGTLGVVGALVDDCGGR